MPAKEEVSVCLMEEAEYEDTDVLLSVVAKFSEIDTLLEERRED